MTKKAKKDEVKYAPKPGHITKGKKVRIQTAEGWKRRNKENGSK